jgi:hypothetical protein
MASYPLGFRLAQAIGISGAAWLSGMYLLFFSPRVTLIPRRRAAYKYA